MNTPDKIYIQPNAHDGWFEGEKPSDIFEEYIRKDVLMEWLRKEYETISWYHEKMKHVTGCIGDTDSSGKAEAYKEVIEKIESL